MVSIQQSRQLYLLSSARLLDAVPTEAMLFYQQKLVILNLRTWHRVDQEGHSQVAVQHVGLGNVQTSCH